MMDENMTSAVRGLFKWKLCNQILIKDVIKIYCIYIYKYIYEKIVEKMVEWKFF